MKTATLERVNGNDIEVRYSARHGAWYGIVYSRGMRTSMGGFPSVREAREEAARLAKALEPRY